VTLRRVPWVFIGVGHQLEARDRVAEIGHRLRDMRDISNAAMRQIECTRVGCQGGILNREGSVRRPAEAVLASLSQYSAMGVNQPFRWSATPGACAPIGNPGTLVLQIPGGGNAQEHRAINATTAAARA